MTNLLSIIISLVVLLLIIFIKDVRGRKNYNCYRGIQHFKLISYNRVLIVISFIIFITVVIIEYFTKQYDWSWLSVVTIAINALTVAIITMPITISNIYNIKELEHKLIYTKYVVTDIYDKKMIDAFNRAGIKVIVLTEKNFRTNIPRVEEKEFNRKMLTGNLIINTSDTEFIKRLDNAVYEFKDLNKLYRKIEYSRGKIDNIARIIKYNILTYLPLLIVYFVLVISKYPVYYNVLIIILMKLLTVLTTEFVYKKMDNDSDLMKRTSMIEGKLIGAQETIFLIATSICIAFLYSLPYQYIIYQEGTINLAISILLTTFIFSNIFITYCLYSESALITNIVKSVKSIRIIVYVIILIIISILLNFVHFLGTKNIGLHNYFVSILFGLLPILILEIIKFARFTTTRGVKKSASKNYQKNRRS